MAIVTTTGTLIRQYNAFSGLSAIERSQSGIARAEVIYYNVNDDWNQPGAGNNRLYTSGAISLPKDFGYVLTDAYVAVDASGSSLQYLEMTGQFRILPGGVLGPQINLTLKAEPSKQDNSGDTAVGSITADRYNTSYPSIRGNYGRTQYSLVDKPSAIIYPFGSSQYTSVANPASIFEFAIGEDPTNGPDYVVTSYVRFLQYDIDQSYNYVIQSPQLTR